MGTDLAPCQHVLKRQQGPGALEPSFQGHPILEGRAGSFLLRQRTQTQLSEVARCPTRFLTNLSPAGIANTHQWGDGFLVPQPHREAGGSQTPCQPHANFRYAAFLGSSGESSSVSPYHLEPLFPHLKEVNSELGDM